MKQAILIIDVQQALFDQAPRPYEADLVVERINALCARARSVGIPVFWIQHEDLHSLAFASAGWKLQSQLVTLHSDTLIQKRTPDAFLGTTLAVHLTDCGARRVVIAGYASEFCIDTTVRRAAALGYEVVIASDAHTTHDKAHASAAFIRQHHNATLSDISSFGIKIVAVPSADVKFDGCRPGTVVRGDAAND